MIVNDIFNYLNALFPVTDAMDFDNVGLLVGDGEKEVKKVLIALDCNLNTVDFAESLGSDLIITHHPVIFTPLKSVLSNSVIYKLIKNDISVISMHTNLDVGVGGINDCLCKKIGISNITSVIASDGYLLKGGIIPETNAKTFAKALYDNLGGRIKYIDGEQSITKVLVCSGSGGEFLHDAKINGYDALVTADIKHHQFLEAQDLKISLFDAGHFETEDIIVEPLKKILSEKFDNVEFYTFHSDAIKYN